MGVRPRVQSEQHPLPSLFSYDLSSAISCRLPSLRGLMVFPLGPREPEPTKCNKQACVRGAQEWVSHRKILRATTGPSLPPSATLPGPAPVSGGKRKQGMGRFGLQLRGEAGEDSPCPAAACRRKGAAAGLGGDGGSPAVLEGPAPPARAHFSISSAATLRFS